MTDQLLPCPFCGKQPKRFDYSGDERDSYADRVVYECACGCKKGAIGNTSKPGYADNSKVEQQAIAAWNTRAQPSSEPKPAEDDECTHEFVPFRKECVRCGELFTRPAPAGVVDLQARVNQLELGLGLMLCNYDDGVGREWEQPVLDFARALCPAVDSQEWANLNGAPK